jgi:hypothetical protein
MRRWIILIALVLGITVLVVPIVLRHGPGAAERCYARVKMGMDKANVCSLVGRKPDLTANFSERTLPDLGDREYFWESQEWGSTVEIRVQFDDDGRVFRKYFTKSRRTDNGVVVESQLVEGADDSWLVSAVRRAASRERVQPSTIPRKIGVWATFHEIRDGMRDAIPQGVFGVFELDHEEISDVTSVREIIEAEEVMYWTRPVESKNPRVVGICWSKDGRARAFFCIIYPP